MPPHIFYFIAGLLGVAFKTLQKISSLQKTYEKSNEVFVWRKYWAGEWVALSSSILVVAIASITIDEIVTFRPQVLTYVRLFFVAIGWMGTDILLAVLGKSKGYIMNIIDRKTNIADAK
jgi:hypothetical protein